MTYFHLILCQRKQTQPRPLHGNRMTHKESHSQRQNIEMLYLGCDWGPVGTREQRQWVHCVACSKEPEFWWGILFLVRGQSPKIFLSACGLWWLSCANKAFHQFWCDRRDGVEMASMFKLDRGSFFLWGFLSFISVAMIKYPNKKQLKEEKFCTTFKATLFSIMVGKLRQ